MLVGLLFAAPGGPPASAPGGDAATGAAAPAKAPAAEGAAWTPLEPGLDLGVFSGPSGASGDGKIWIVRIDPSQFELRLVNASAGDARPHTVRGWATSTINKGVASGCSPPPVPSSTPAGATDTGRQS